MKKGLCLVGVTGVFVVATAVPAMAQSGVVSDWSNHQVKFMNPGSETDAAEKGQDDVWKHFVNQPRYRVQQIKRSAEWANRFAEFDTSFVESEEQRDSDLRVLGRHDRKNGMKRDWAVSIAPSGYGVATAMFPAEYGASYTTASCNDYVVFPVNKAGANTGTKQANLVAFDSLYKTTCSGTVPTVKFAYYISTGTVSTSPAISESGAKLAFVVSIASGSTFDVLTLDTTGKGNGTAYNSPAVPGTGNNAKLTSLKLNGNRSVTYSSPFVDYDDDLVYVGDDSGYLHKITCVFNAISSTCTPAEVTTGGWPFQVVKSGSTTLSAPIYDPTSGNIYVGAGSGYVYCVSLNSTAPKACTTGSVGVANGSASDAIVDAPIVVSNGTSSWVFSQGTGGTAFGTGANGYVMQVPTSASSGFGTPVYSIVGINADGVLHSGDFDNNYYSATAGGYSNAHVYFCGFANYAGYGEPTLYQIGFNANGIMKSTSVQGPQLIQDNVNDTDECTPLTEVYNGTTDYLFLGANDKAQPSGCANEGCVMSFNLGATFGTSLAPIATFPLGGTAANAASGIVIDNVSATKGASQIYFGNMENGDATQASQAGLQ